MQDNSHEAIIDPDQFEQVQDMIAQRSGMKHYSGVSVFSSKIRCGCCGGWYGSKVWHNTDKYRRVIWRCNAKYKDKEKKCDTPHLTEDEIKAAFVRMANRLLSERGPLISDLREIQDSYTCTEDLELELRKLDERMNTEAEAVQDLIAENARVAQDQEEYNARYDSLVAKFESIKARREQVAADIRSRSIRRREFQRFISVLETLPEQITEFDEALWGSLVESMTVCNKDDIRFTLPSGMEMKA